jgi:hypothetical protein
VLGQFEAKPHLHAIADGEAPAFLGALNSVMAENMARNPRPSGVARSSEGKSRNLKTPEVSMAVVNIDGSAWDWRSASDNL